MKTILVCGGAGYIGSHMVKMLSGQGHRVITFDNLSTGHGEAVRWGELIVGDLMKPKDIAALFERYRFDAVFHFAARSLVGESVRHPDIYYRNNVIGTLNLLDAMICTGVKKLVFSSTAAIFGNPQAVPIDEQAARQPVNPYGTTKLQVEQILHDYAEAYGLNSVSLRYFNAAGADPDSEIGEDHEPETHLIPNILKSVLEKNQDLCVFGNQYPTPDGTCVRDYIHVNDLCQAHLAALDFLARHDGAFSFNLGNGSGFSVMDVIKAAEAVTGQEIAYAVKPPRPGDPATLVSDSSLAREQLGWQPTYVELDDILETAWQWHLKLYRARIRHKPKTAA